MHFKSSADTAIAATLELANALRHPSPTWPICPVTNNQRTQLQQLADIFHQHTQTLPVPPSAAPTAPPQHTLPALTMTTTPVPSVFPSMVPQPTVVTHIIHNAAPAQVLPPRMAPSVYARPRGAPGVGLPPRVAPLVMPRPRVVPNIIPPPRVATTTPPAILSTARH
jgi:hypothetical protein